MFMRVDEWLCPREQDTTWDYGVCGTFENWIDNLREQDMNTEKSMGHFTNWKFGVPVRTIWREIQAEVNTGRLIYETPTKFISVRDDGHFVTYQKSAYYYELISYKIAGATPRYPICQLPTDTGSYCNPYGNMERVSSYSGSPELIPEPTATLIIDGKEIELSAETVARLKKDLEV